MLACMPSARLGSLPANSLVCPVSMVCLLQLQLPVALLYPRICWSALFRGYACLYAACTARFFTREFDGLPCFDGMLASAAVAGRASLPANSMVCPVSRVCLLQLRLPGSLLYPRIRWSALFRGYACLSDTCPARFFTREFVGLPCFAGMRAASAVAGRTSSPANSLVCPVSRVCLLQLQLPDALLYPRILVFSLPRALSVYTSVVIPVSIC